MLEVSRVRNGAAPQAQRLVLFGRSEGMHFKIAQSLLVAGLAVSVCGMGIDAAASVGSRGEYLRGSCQVISALSSFFLFRHLRDQQKRREPKSDPPAV